MDKSSSHEDLDEVFAITSELITVLASDDTEFQRLRECANLEQVQNKLYEDRHDKIKDEIIAMTSEYDGERNKVSQLNSTEQMKEISDLKQRLQKDIQHKTSVQQQCEDLKKQLDVCNEEREALEEEKERVLNSTTKVIPGHRHDVNLYNYISGIRWQYDCPKDEVKGYVANKKQVKPFSLNTKQNSQFFIVNYLWDLIENEWE